MKSWMDVNFYWAIGAKSSFFQIVSMDFGCFHKISLAHHGSDEFISCLESVLYEAIFYNTYFVSLNLDNFCYE